MRRVNDLASRFSALRLGLTVIFAGLVGGCNNMKIDEFAAVQPTLKIEEYFLGNLRAWGMFHDRFGNLRRQFVVDIKGTIEGEELVLREDFVYNDGETQQRVWRIRALGDGRYEGRADDVVGVAAGRAKGNALNWTYKMDLKVGDGSWRVSFDDWMFLQSDGMMLNHATVSRWGFDFGVVTIAFRKLPDANQAASTLQPQPHSQAAE
ncbi:DUF3833 domain-containing protein [Dongia sp.]|uniref:DUF3833 domain-containing protein n=1 Tax=Dongia sp. TaxID=1977262 RepID=UPI0035B4E130